MFGYFILHLWQIQVGAFWLPSCIALRGSCVKEADEESYTVSQVVAGCLRANSFSKNPAMVRVDSSRVDNEWLSMKEASHTRNCGTGSWSCGLCTALRCVAFTWGKSWNWWSFDLMSSSHRRIFSWGNSCGWGLRLWNRNCIKNIFRDVCWRQSIIDNVALIFVGGTVTVFTQITICFGLKRRCSVQAEHQNEGEATAEATETKERAGVLTQPMEVQTRNVKISPTNLQVLPTKRFGFSHGTCWFTSKNGMKSFGDSLSWPWDWLQENMGMEATTTGHLARNGPWDLEGERLQGHHFGRFQLISNISSQFCANSIWLSLMSQKQGFLSHRS